MSEIVVWRIQIKLCQGNGKSWVAAVMYVENATRKQAGRIAKEVGEQSAAIASRYASDISVKTIVQKLN